MGAFVIFTANFPWITKRTLIDKYSENMGKKNMLCVDIIRHITKINK